MIDFRSHLKANKLPSGITNLSGLTDGQIRGFELLSSGHGICLLKGYAGTGKSFLVKRFVDSISQKRVVVCAPTHRAVSVVNGDSTIHSYLSLKLKTRGRDQILVPGPFQDNIDFEDIVIIDEASMVSTELLSYILKAQEEYDLKIIFIGDFKQCPPINELISPVEKLDIPTVSLTEIVRQAADNRIIQLASHVRMGNMHDLTQFVDNKNIFTGRLREMTEFFVNCLYDNKDEVPEIISHKNRTVDKSNVWARNIVMSNPDDPYLIGESVCIRTTNEYQKHKLEDIVEIKSMSDPEIFDTQATNKMRIIRIMVSSHKGNEELMIPATPRDVAIFEQNQSHLASLANSKTIPWKKFWQYTNAVSMVKHIYAKTVHRAQGSSIKNIIVNARDIPNSKLLYTAITRASDKLFLAV